VLSEYWTRRWTLWLIDSSSSPYGFQQCLKDSRKKRHELKHLKWTRNIVCNHHVPQTSWVSLRKLRLDLELITTHLSLGVMLHFPQQKLLKFSNNCLRESNVSWNEIVLSMFCWRVTELASTLAGRVISCCEGRSEARDWGGEGSW